MKNIAFLLAIVPAILGAYETGPPAGYTGAPGDNPTACISAGCHTGTANSGHGNVKITLPAGNSGTYVPGQAMKILVQITDSTKSAFGFELTARMGNGDNTQAGDLATTDANTQAVCFDGPKQNGKPCSATFPIQYIEHSFTGYEASTQASPKGSFTYAFNWTPPASGSGTVTLYAAANCGPGDPPTPSPTNVYTTKISLTQATGGPTISGVYDAESARAAFTSGQWVAIYGSGLSNTTRFWGDSDFTGGTSPGSPLPTKIDGVSVTIGGQPASVYFVSPTQLNVLAPSNLVLGATQVVVTNNGASSAAFSGTVVSSSPSFFYYPAGGSLYPLAAHLDGTLVGDPAVLSNSRKAQPGETLEFFANGIAAAQGGIIVPVTQFPQQVSIRAGSAALTTSPSFLVSAGEFQVNGTLPTSLAAGNYTLTMSVEGGGSTADSGVTITLPVGP